MPSRIYPFVQIEIPFALGPPDGRWMVREESSAQVQHVIVLLTVHGTRAESRRPRSGGRSRPSRLRRLVGRRSDEPDLNRPPAVPITRATVVAAQPLQDDAHAQDRLSHLDEEREIADAFAALNRLLAAQRIAAADPYVHELTPAQALSIRAGFGAGEQVAEGRWLQAHELHLRPPRRPWRKRRAAIVRPQERLANLLSSQQRPLLCEELALRARLDLDYGRLAHAAGELERAFALALVELEGEQGVALPRRLAELRELQAGVRDVAMALLPTGAAAQHEGTGEPSAAGEPSTAGEPSAAQAGADRASPDAAETLAHALGRLEAALRARAVALTGR